MSLLIWAGVLPLCLVLALGLLRRPIRLFFEELHVDQARELFHRQREHLEARFVSALSRLDPGEGSRWEDAHWHDEVFWARDRQSRHFLALVCVHFGLYPDEPLALCSHATAVFEYCNRQWRAEGKRLDEIRPEEVVGRNRRFEPVAIVHPHQRRLV
jgi:hypothetical protein